jgi:NADPH:quinone reductase-like Zn-dependent oxidoreductase
MKAIRIHGHGEIHALGGRGAPGPGEAPVRHTAIAVNFSDVNQPRRLL